jgi:hypothetical protein
MKGKRRGNQEFKSKFLPVWRERNLLSRFNVMNPRVPKKGHNFLMLGDNPQKLTPLSSAILEKPPAVQLLKNFPTF